MDTASTWTSIEILKVVSSIATPFIIAVLGFIFTLALRRIEKKDALAEKEIALAPHIELDIECRFMGPSYGCHLAEFSVTAYNKGVYIHRFPKIMFRVRGIRFGQELKYWEENEPRLNFPEKILETDLVHQAWNFIFVQPNIKQRISFATYIEEGFQFVTAYAEFYYDKYTPHSVEKVFEIPRIEEA